MSKAPAGLPGRWGLGVQVGSGPGTAEAAAPADAHRCWPPPSPPTPTGSPRRSHRLWTCVVKPGLGLLHGRKGSAPTSPISRGPARPASRPDAGAPGQTCCGHSGPGTGGQHGLSPFQTVQGPSVVRGVLPRSAFPSVPSPSCPQGESPPLLRPGGTRGTGGVQLATGCRKSPPDAALQVAL